MTSAEFTVLDGSRFPIVALDTGKLRSVKIETMISDFESLLSGGQPFVLLMTGERPSSDRAHDDQKRWVLWLKENRERMGRCCQGIVKVGDQSSDLAIQRKQVTGLQAMLGVQVTLAINVEEAAAIAAELLH